MNVLDGLAASAGSWEGTNTLQDPHSNMPDDSSSTAIVTPVLGGRFAGSITPGATAALVKKARC